MSKYTIGDLKITCIQCDIEHESDELLVQETNYSHRYCCRGCERTLIEVLNKDGRIFLNLDLLEKVNDNK